MSILNTFGFYMRILRFDLFFFSSHKFLFVIFRSGQFDLQ